MQSVGSGGNYIEKKYGSVIRAVCLYKFHVMKN